MYLNTCRNIETLSAASYAIKYPNIHVVRGMAKDFGLCGIKIGITISSNPNVI
jgi:histidinol-phosphate/aromatic aminotransferase/cobyric acid decarboxylase-like protein